MYAVLAPTAEIQPWTALATNSGPLSDRMRPGILGKPDAVKIVPISFAQRWTSLNSDEICAPSKLLS